MGVEEVDEPNVIVGVDDDIGAIEVAVDVGDVATAIGEGEEVGEVIFVEGAGVGEGTAVDEGEGVVGGGTAEDIFDILTDVGGEFWFKPVIFEEINLFEGGGLIEAAELFLENGGEELFCFFGGEAVHVAVLKGVSEAAAHGGVAVFESATAIEVGKGGDAGGIIAEDLLDLFKGGSFVADGALGADFEDVGSLAMAVEVDAFGAEDEIARVATIEDTERDRLTVAEEGADKGAVSGGDIDGGIGGDGGGIGVDGKREGEGGGGGAKEAGEFTDGGEDLDAEETLELVEGHEMVAAGGASGEGGADGDFHLRVAGAEIVGEEGDFGFCPDAHEANPNGVVGKRFEDGGDIGTDEIIEAGGVDDMGGSIREVWGEGEVSARGIDEAMGAKLAEVFSLKGVVGVMPVADMDDGEIGWVLGVGPFHGAGDGTDFGGITNEALGFVVADVELVGEGLVTAEGLDEIVLETLGDKNSGHYSPRRAPPQ